MAVDVGAGDRTARLAALFDAHHNRLFRLARRLVRTPDEARDLVQETFLKAARSLTSVPHGPRDEEAWLVRVLVNLQRDHWRKIAVRRRSEDRLRREETAPGSDQESALIARTAVWRALDMLHPRRRAIVIMHELEGMTAPAIAALLSISAITVRWHLSRGRRDLTRVLKARMGETK
ncbi:MAG: RNA polymerase sigma factor [Acidobacteriia bacterium]|nr:RNA polymerase sigma factor [Terriglobia bacterium]